MSYPAQHPEQFNAGWDFKEKRQTVETSALSLLLNFEVNEPRGLLHLEAAPHANAHDCNQEARLLRQAHGILGSVTIPRPLGALGQAAPKAAQARLTAAAS